MHAEEDDDENVATTTTTTDDARSRDGAARCGRCTVGTSSDDARSSPSSFDDDDREEDAVDDTFDRDAHGQRTDVAAPGRVGCDGRDGGKNDRIGIVDATANPAMSCPYPPYLEPSNLDPSTWMHAMGGNGAASAAATNRYDATRYSYSLSAAAALTTAAAIAVHPLSIVGAAAAVTTAATMWAVGYHRDGASSSTNDGGDGSGGYIYKIWSGGEEVFGKLFWSESENENDDDGPAMVVELEEEDGDDDDESNDVDVNESGCGGMMMGMRGDDNDDDENDDGGNVKYVARCLGIMNVIDDERRPTAAAVVDRLTSTKSRTEERRRRRWSLRRRREEERERGMVTGVKFNGEEDEEEEEDGGDVGDASSRQRRRRLGHELRGCGIRRIRSAPAKGGGGIVLERRHGGVTNECIDDQDGRLRHGRGGSVALREARSLQCLPPFYEVFHSK